MFAIIIAIAIIAIITMTRVAYTFNFEEARKAYREDTILRYPSISQNLGNTQNFVTDWFMSKEGGSWNHDIRTAQASRKDNQKHEKRFPLTSSLPHATKKAYVRKTTQLYENLLA